MNKDVWGIGHGHAYAPGNGFDLGLDPLGPLAPLMESGAGVAAAVAITFVLARVMDHLFSPPLQRRFGPRPR